MNLFNAKDFSIGTNIIAPGFTPGLNHLLTKRHYTEKGRQWEWWYKIIQNGGFIITCIHDPTDTVAGITTLLPIKSEIEGNSCSEFLKIVHEQFEIFSEPILRSMNQEAKIVTKTINWDLRDTEGMTKWKKVLK